MTSHHVTLPHRITTTIFILPIIRGQATAGGDSNVPTLRAKRRQMGGKKGRRGRVENALGGKGDVVFGFDS